MIDHESKYSSNIPTIQLKHSQQIPIKITSSSVPIPIINRLNTMSLQERSYRFSIRNNDIIEQLRYIRMQKKQNKQMQYNQKERLNKQERYISQVLMKKSEQKIGINDEIIELSNEIQKYLIVISRNELFDELRLNKQILGNMEKLLMRLDDMSKFEKYDVLENLREEEKRQIKVVYSICEMIKQNISKQQQMVYFDNKLRHKTNKIWRDMNLQKKKQILNLDKFQNILQQYQIKVQKKYHHYTQIPNQKQLNQYIQKLNLIYNPQIYQYLTQNTLDQSCDIFTPIKFILFTKIIKQIHKNNHKKRKNKIQKSKTQTTQVQDIEGQPFSICKNQKTKQKNNYKQNKIKKYKNNQQNTVKNQSKSLQKCKNQLKQEQKIQKNINKEQKQIIKKNHNIKNNKIKTKKYIQAESQEKVNYNQQQLSQQQIHQKNKKLQQIYHQKLKNDIIELTDSLSESANFYAPYRIIAFNRIQYLLNMWRVPLKIFGSCATGLALQNSDIDLAIDSSILNYYYYSILSTKDKVCAALADIHNLLQQRLWISNIKFVPTAAIPVLKFQINPNILFELSPKDPYLNIMKQKDKFRKIIIKADLTIQYNNGNSEQSSHLGIMATTLMNQWISTYPSLHTLTLLLKYMLKKKELNNVYKGGISSYCVMIMIIAYLHHKNLMNEKNTTKILYGLIDFYTKDFKHQKVGIDIRKDENENFPFFDIQESEINNRIQVKDPLNGKIISMNSYQYPKILQSLMRLKQIKKKVQSQLSKYGNNNIKIPERSKIFSKNFVQQYFNQNLIT